MVTNQANVSRSSQIVWVWAGEGHNDLDKGSEGPQTGTFIAANWDIFKLTFVCSFPPWEVCGTVSMLGGQMSRWCSPWTQRIENIRLIVPCVTCWNSENHCSAKSCVYKWRKTGGSLWPPGDSRDVFPWDYLLHRIYWSLSIALDLLQGEKKCRSPLWLLWRS